MSSLNRVLNVQWLHHFSKTDDAPNSEQELTIKCLISAYRSKVKRIYYQQKQIILCLSDTLVTLMIPDLDLL